MLDILTSSAIDFADNFLGGLVLFFERMGSMLASIKRSSVIASTKRALPSQRPRWMARISPATLVGAGHQSQSQATTEVLQLYQRYTDTAHPQRHVENINSMDRCINTV